MTDKLEIFLNNLKEDERARLIELLEECVEKLKVIAELKRFAKEHNGKFKDVRFYLWYNYVDKYVTTLFVSHPFIISAIAFSSEEIAEQAISAIGEERLKKYYFEVED